MKTGTLPQSNWLTTAGLILALPTTYFIGANFLNELSISGPYNAIDSLVEQMGGQEPLGWNINLLILLGPIIALFISVFQVMSIEWHFTKEQFQFNVRIQRKWFPIFVALLSIGLLAILFVYLIAENYNSAG